MTQPLSLLDDVMPEIQVAFNPQFPVLRDFFFLDPLKIKKISIFLKTRTVSFLQPLNHLRSLKLPIWNKSYTLTKKTMLILFILLTEENGFMVPVIESVSWNLDGNRNRKANIKVSVSGLYHSAVSVIEPASFMHTCPFNGLSLSPALSASKNKDRGGNHGNMLVTSDMFFALFELVPLASHLFLDIGSYSLSL